MRPTDRPGRWYDAITRYQWLVFVIASAGWVFDVFEGQLFTIFKTPALLDLLGYATTAASDPRVASAVDQQANVATAFFLLGGAAGGLVFGIVADRVGRIRALSLTILTYSLFSALTFFAQAVWQMHALRFLVALGTGGEWAIAAALVAETFPTRARALASGSFHASSVLGVAIAALMGRVLKDPGSWRWGFLLGLAPALLILWIRMSLREPEDWAAARRQALAGQKLGDLGELLGDRRWNTRAWLGLGLAAVGLSSYWSIFAWVPELVVDTLGPSVPIATRRATASSAYLMMNCTGGLLGLLSFAPVAAWKGRRLAFAVYHLGAIVMVPVTCFGSRSYEATLWLLPVMGFFVLGMHAGYAIYLPELFPTRLRATGASFCFNVGRLASGAVLLIRSAIRDHLTLRQSLVAMSSLFLVGLALLIFAPETRGQSLPE
ncbi:MAG TPA: MFS transporter [Isosphaeraceae bacterium]|jgi:MFS family permease|nr:MFS transporter [Isosphaeraceae bacterium]